MELVIGIILIVAALFLIIAVLMQHGKDHNLSGTIAGASESFFGKSKSTTLDKKLSVLTSVVAVVFVVLVLVMYLGQGKFNPAPATDSSDTQVESVSDGTESAAESESDAESESESAEAGTEAETEPATEPETESAEESEPETEAGSGN